MNSKNDADYYQAANILSSQIRLNEPGDNVDNLIISLEEYEQMRNQHYAQFSPQTIQRLQDVLTPEEFQGFCRGNIMKYAERLRAKDDPLSNALKIRDYAYWLTESLQDKKITVPINFPDP